MNIKLNEPDETELKIEKWLDWAWKSIKKGSIRFNRYLFFYQPENKMDATLHVIEIIAWLFLGYRLSQ